MTPIVHIVVVLVTVTLFGISNADYQCVCNYNKEKEVMPNIGYIKVDQQTQKRICQGTVPSFDKELPSATYLISDRCSIVSFSNGLISLVYTNLVVTVIAPTTTSTLRTTTNPTTPTTTKITTKSTKMRSTTITRIPNPSTTSQKTTPTTTTTTTLRTTTQPTTKLTTPTTCLPTTSTPTITASTTTTTKTTTITTTTKRTTPLPTTSTTQTSTSTTTPTTTARLTSPTISKYPTTTVYVVSGKPSLCPPALRTRVQANRNILTQYGDSCYEIVANGQAQWINAETYCKQYGGHLVAIDTNGEQIFINNYLRHNYFHSVWIGLNRTGNNNNSLRWITGDQVSYAHWHSTPSSGCTMLSPSDAGRWYSKPCQSNLSYICEFDRHSTVSIAPVVVTQPATKSPVTDSSENIISGRPNMCPNNLIYHVKDVGSHLTQYGNMCYEMVGDQYSWSQAENYCSKFGGHLVTIDNSQEQTFIYKYITQYFQHSVWIGLSDAVTEGNFKWSSGSRSGYRHWYANPNDWKSGYEDCALLTMTHNGGWDNRDCDSTHYFMCEYNINGIQMPTTPAPATGFTVPGDTSRCSSRLRSWAKQDGGELGYYHGSCYELLPNDKVSHEHAKDMCNDRGGELVDILNQSEQNFVEAFLKMFSPQHAVWTGLHDKYQEHYFEWQSGARVQYTNWIPGHVSNFVNHRDEDCVVIIPYKGGQWDDIPCGSYDYFFGDSDETHPPLCEFSESFKK